MNIRRIIIIIVDFRAFYKLLQCEYNNVHSRNRNSRAYIYRLDIYLNECKADEHKYFINRTKKPDIKIPQFSYYQQQKNGFHRNERILFDSIQ